MEREKKREREYDIKVNLFENDLGFILYKQDNTV